MTRLDTTSGNDVADKIPVTPGVALADRVLRGTEPAVSPPARFPGGRDGHTTSGLDFALQALADRIHPTGV